MTVTFEMTPVVWVRIRAPLPLPGEWPQIGMDGGVVRRFQNWCMENNVTTAIVAGSVGGGRMSMGFAPEDADKIRTFLLAEGCVETTE